MSCQFHPTISDSKPASPTAVLLHLYYLHDPRLGLPRSHHSLSADTVPPPPPACQLDDDDSSELDDYDDEELWCAGPGLYVAYECVRVWVEADTAVRELCEHLEDVVSWPIDDMGVQVWHADSKLHPTHTFSQLAWFRQLLPATAASPPSSPFDRLLLCLPADPCVCAHCCRIDFARAKRRVKLVRRHIEQHYTEVVMADDEEEEEEVRKREKSRSGAGGGKGKRGGKSVEEDDSWMDEVETSDKSGKEKGGASKGGKSGGGKKKQSKEAQRLNKKEREAKEEKERRAREAREREEVARQERAKREAATLAEQEKVERDREEARRLDEERRSTAMKKQRASQAPFDKLQPLLKSQQQHNKRKAKLKATANSSDNTTHAPHKPTAAADSEQPHTAVEQDVVLANSPQQQQQTRWRPIADSSGVHHSSSPSSRLSTSSTQSVGGLGGLPTVKSAAVSPSTPLSTAAVVPQPPKWSGWGSPCATRTCPPSQPPPLPLSPHSVGSNYTNHSGMSPYPLFSTASTDDDNSSLNSDSFSLFSSASALLPPSSPTSFRSHRLSSASSSSASTVTSPCLSALQSLSPSLPPLFCDKSADMPLPAVLSPFIASRVAPTAATISSRTSTLWPLSQPQHAREGELLRRHWQHDDDDDDEDAVLHAACSEYSHYNDEQQQQQSVEQQWTEQQRGGWHDGGGWTLGRAASNAAAFSKYDGSMYNAQQYRPYREGLLHVGAAGAPVVHSGAVGGGASGPQLYGYMPLVQYVPVYISNEQAQSNGG